MRPGQTIRLIVNVSKIINADPDTKDYLTLLFLPDYSVSLAEMIIPAVRLVLFFLLASFAVLMACFPERYQPAHLDGRYRGIWDVQHEGEPSCDSSPEILADGYFA